VKLARHLLGDARVETTEQQLAVMQHIGDTLKVKPVGRRAAGSRGRKPAKSQARRSARAS
jgi:hypothetical protein